MKKHFILLNILFFVGFTSFSQSVTISRKNNNLLLVKQIQDNISVEYKEVEYLRNNVNVKGSYQFNLKKENYNKLISLLKESYSNKENQNIILNGKQVFIEFRNQFVLYNKHQLGNSFMRKNKAVRFSIDNQGYSAYLDEKEIESLAI